MPDRKKVKILEIGCGPGANIWYLAREGFAVYGIDGSEAAIVKAKEHLQEEGLKAYLQVGDVMQLSNFYPPLYFDAVVDVACMQHNEWPAIQTILDQVLTVLKPGGRVFSMMVASGSWGNGLGREIELGTFVDIKEGPLQCMGLCHFFSLKEVQRLFGRFSEVQIEYSSRSLSSRCHWYKHWVVEGAKRL